MQAGPHARHVYRGEGVRSPEPASSTALPVTAEPIYTPKPKKKGRNNGSDAYIQCSCSIHKVFLVVLVVVAMLSIGLLGVAAISVKRGLFRSNGFGNDGSASSKGVIGTLSSVIRLSLHGLLASGDNAALETGPGGESAAADHEVDVSFSSLLGFASETASRTASNSETPSVSTSNPPSASSTATLTPASASRTPSRSHKLAAGKKAGKAAAAVAAAAKEKSPSNSNTGTGSASLSPSLSASPTASLSGAASPSQTPSPSLPAPWWSKWLSDKGWMGAAADEGEDGDSEDGEQQRQGGDMSGEEEVREPEGGDSSSVDDGEEEEDKDAPSLSNRNSGSSNRSSVDAALSAAVASNASSADVPVGLASGVATKEVVTRHSNNTGAGEGEEAITPLRGENDDEAGSDDGEDAAEAAEAVQAAASSPDPSASSAATPSSAETPPPSKAPEASPSSSRSLTPSGSVSKSAKPTHSPSRSAKKSKSERPSRSASKSYSPTRTGTRSVKPSKKPKPHGPFGGLIVNASDVIGQCTFTKCPNKDASSPWRDREMKIQNRTQPASAMPYVYAIVNHRNRFSNLNRLVQSIEAATAHDPVLSACICIVMVDYKSSVPAIQEDLRASCLPRWDSLLPVPGTLGADLYLDDAAQDAAWSNITGVPVRTDDESGKMLAPAGAPKMCKDSVYGLETYSAISTLLGRYRGESYIIKGDSYFDSYSRAGLLSLGMASIATHPSESLVFLVDVDMLVLKGFFEELLEYPIPGRQVFFPVVWSGCYGADVSTFPTNRSWPSGKESRGWWRTTGTGMVVTYMKDMYRCGGYGADFVNRGEYGNEDWGLGELTLLPPYILAYE